MSMPAYDARRVFLVQEPLRRNPVDRSKIELKYSLEPLKQYGPLHVLLAWEDSRMPVNGARIVAKLRRELADFTSDDLIACAGSPALIAAAAMVASQRTDGYVQMLVWDNAKLKYDHIVIDLNAQPTR
jgi:hypothetical protein